MFRRELLLRSKDVDLHRRLRTSRLFELLQEASIRHTEELGMGRDKTLDKGILWIVGLQRAEIRRMPEYEAAIARALGNPEIAVILQNDRPLLIYSGDAKEQDLNKALLPLMTELPRGQRLGGIRITDQPLPRTATGKIKRWELQQKG